MPAAEVVELDPRELFKSFETRKALALAVSGGSDSMAMLCLADEWRKQGGRPVIHLLTVNHNLRAAAAEEAEQVARWCAMRDLPHTVLEWRHDGVTSGVQARARAARYDLMTDWCLAHGIGHLLTAHTLDDQAETVLMRQRRTSTAASLAGVWRERLWNGVCLSRPLLGCRRDALRAYLYRTGQPWIEDPSNDNPAFERVRIRRELESQSSAVSETLAGVAALAAAEQASVRETASRWLEQAHIWQEGYAQVERAAFAALPANAGNCALQFLITALGGSQVTPGELERLQAWLAAPGPGRRTLGGCLFGKRARSFVVGREPGRINPVPVAVPPSGKLLWDGRFMVHAPPGAAVAAAAHAGLQGGPAAAPGFVRQGWPVILGPNGAQSASQIEFRPRLR